MGDEVLSRCGYRCDLCLAYRKNIERQDMRSELSDGWHKCFGFRIPADSIMCGGCFGAGPTLDASCPVRPCVVSRGLRNCSQCAEYPCDTFRKREVVFEEVARGKEISSRERELFVLPYENKARLNALRKARR